MKVFFSGFCLTVSCYILQFLMVAVFNSLALAQWTSYRYRGERWLLLHVKPIMLGQVTCCDISEQCKRLYMKYFLLVTHSAVKFLLLTFTKYGVLSLLEFEIKRNSLKNTRLVYTAFWQVCISKLQRFCFCYLSYFCSSLLSWYLVASRLVLHVNCNAFWIYG